MKFTGTVPPPQNQQMGRSKMGKFIMFIISIPFVAIGFCGAVVFVGLRVGWVVYMEWKP
jgi:hypothetical protein